MKLGILAYYWCIANVQRSSVVCSLFGAGQQRANQWERAAVYSLLRRCAIFAALGCARTYLVAGQNVIT